MTVYDLEQKTKKTSPYYFSADTLRFFGERKSDMRVLNGLTTVTDIMGESHVCVVLSKLSRNYPGGPRRTRDYFDTETWERVFVK
jgi:hypothetical protein